MNTISTITKQNDLNEPISNFETVLSNILISNGLPSENILIGVKERVIVFKNFDDVVTGLNDLDKANAIYISKFVFAIAVGLFDAALNYLWDETILQIRKRVSQYDLEYFYDNAISSSENRSKFNVEEDLKKLDDYSLIKGAKEIGLISENGFKHLEFINYNRNWASAAHPNQHELTGLNLINWLETCIKEVISLPIGNVAIHIKKLLNNIKSTQIDSVSAKEISQFFINMTGNESNNLALGFFGIYTKIGTNSQTIQNINLLLPYLWGYIDESTKNSFGLKHSHFVANNLQHENKQAKEFLQIVNAESYISDELKVVDIDQAIENLMISHRGLDNFYNESAFARQLIRLIGDPPKVPKNITKKYIISLVEVFLTNANGVAISAEPIYIKMLRNLNSNQANIAVLSFTESNITSKLQFRLCKKKFKELVSIVKPAITAPSIKDIINKIEADDSDIANLKYDKSLKSTIDNLGKTIMQ